MHLPPERIFGEMGELVARAGPTSVVLSAEHFSSRFCRPQIEKLARWLLDYSVIVVLYLRHQTDLLLSSFSTFLRQGDRNWFDAEIANARNRYFNYLEIADDWASVFGSSNLTVRSYDRAATQGIENDLLSVVGIEGIKVLPVPRVNARLSHDQARLLYLINQHLPTWEESIARGEPEQHATANAVREYLLKGLGDARCHAPLSQLLDGKTWTLLFERFRVLNELLDRRYGIMIAVPSEPATSVQRSSRPRDVDLLARAAVAVGFKLVESEAKRSRSSAGRSPERDSHLPIKT